MVQATTHLNIEVTSQCNQHCFYCFNDSRPSFSHTPLSVQQWLQILSMLKEQGLKSIHLTGGEPFLWPGTVPLLDAAQANGLGTSILSNGYGIPAHLTRHQEVFRRLKVAQISLDSIDPAIHNSRRGHRGAWLDATRAITALRDAFIPVEVSAVIDECNLGEIPNLISFCESKNCYLLLRPVATLGRYKSMNGSDVSTLRDVVTEYALSSARCVEDRFDYVPGQTSAGSTTFRKLTVSPRGILRSGCILFGSEETSDLKLFLAA